MNNYNNVKTKTTNKNIDTNECEVFRITPEEGKYYKTTTYTNMKNNKYFSTNELRYVGKYLRHASCGFRDAAEHYAIFDKYGVEEIVKYTYEGTTCFVEVDIKIINPELKKELLQKIQNKLIFSLHNLCKHRLSTEEIQIVREFEV